MIMKFFNIDPLIVWSVVKCPLCNNPTGPSSKCYDLEPNKKVPEYKLKITTESSIPLPVFTENCVFRQKESWLFNINYPLSQPLYEQFIEVHGVEQIDITGNYSAIIVIGNLFKADNIKKEITLIYKNFIKQMQSLEGDSYDVKSNIIGITMPNNQKFTIDTDSITNEQLIQQQNYIKNICENIENSCLIELDTGDDERIIDLD